MDVFLWRPLATAWPQGNLCCDSFTHQIDVLTRNRINTWTSQIVKKGVSMNSS